MPVATSIHQSEPSTDQAEAGSDAPSDRSQEKDKTPSSPVKSSHIITEHIDVGVPASDAYERWTDYGKWSEMFKKESADAPAGRGGTGRAPRKIQVRAHIGPSERQWTAEIEEAQPGHRIRWTSKGPLRARGTTTFHRLDDRLTRVMVQVEYRPTGLLETVGNFFRMQRRRVRRDLRLFKNFVELGGPSERKGGD